MDNSQLENTINEIRKRSDTLMVSDGNFPTKHATYEANNNSIRKYFFGVYHQKNHIANRSDDSRLICLMNIRSRISVKPTLNHLFTDNFRLS